MYGTIKIGDSRITWSCHGAGRSLTRNCESVFMLPNGGPTAICSSKAVSPPVQGCPEREDEPGRGIAVSPLGTRSCMADRAGAKGGGKAGAGYGMLLVAGGAGFIGSNLVAGLNEAGRTDIVVN